MWIFGKLINSSWLALVLKSFSFTEMSAKNNLIFYLKQVSLCWLSLRAKKLHSFSPVTSKRGSVNPRASSDLDSGTVCSDPEGGLRRSLHWVQFRGWVKLTAGTAWTLCSHLYRTCGIQPLPASVVSGLTWSQEGTGPRWLTLWETVWQSP